MVEYFVTKGKLVVRNGESLVVADGEEKVLTENELVLWTSLHWNVLNKETFRTKFDRKMKEYHLYGDVSFEQTLSRLKARELIVSKSDYLAADALYNLVKDLYVVPLGTVSCLKRMLSFCYMFFIKGVPFKQCKQITDNFKVSELEKRIIMFSKRLKVSTSEIIRISDRNLWDIKSEDDIAPLAYEESEDMGNIGNFTRFSKEKTKVLEAIVNLYLKKQIIFE